MSAKLVLHMKQLQTTKISMGENLGLDRESKGNLKIEFEWVPCINIYVDPLLILYLVVIAGRSPRRV